MTARRAPEGLGAAGGRVWRAAVAEFTFSGPERELLRTLCRLVDELERLEVAVGEAKSLLVKGSTGQPRAHPLLEEVRRHRATMARLVAALGLPEPLVSTAIVSSDVPRLRAAGGERWQGTASS